MKKKIIKISIISLEILAFAVLIYLLVLPFYPIIKYKYFFNADKFNVRVAPLASLNLASSTVQNIGTSTINNSNSFPVSSYSVSENRIIIRKIGVNAPIVEAANEQYGLSRGAWRVPESSTPNKGGNTVITGHRFKYLPPNNLTFYLFHKLSVGDDVESIWQGKTYKYKVIETKIVPDTEISIMDPSDKAILTMFTCDPIYSTKNRLVIVAKLIE